MISVAKATRRILQSIRPLAKERVSIMHGLDRIIAHDVRAKHNIPPFDNSAMDGYAVRARDTKGASDVNPRLLKVVDDIPAGYASEKRLQKHEAIRIMTGAPIPDGADSVVRVEATKIVKNRRILFESRRKGLEDRRYLPVDIKYIVEERRQGVEDRRLRAEDRRQKRLMKDPDAEYVEICREARRGENVRKKGEDVKEKRTVVRKSTALRPQELGMFAALGITSIQVTRRPRVGVLATGDELVESNKPLSKGKIRNSNSFIVSGQVTKCGALPVNLGIARDQRGEIQRKIRDGLKKNLDMLIVLGGISVGDYDLVKDVLLSMGLTMKFWKVAQRPGKPLAFGAINDIPVFGLPGNPVSSAISFEEYVRPALLKMQGAKALRRPYLWATIEEDFHKKKGLRYFIRGKLTMKDEAFFVRPTGPQGSGIMNSLILADCIIVAPEELSMLRKGQRVTVQLLRHGYDGGMV